MLTVTVSLLSYLYNETFTFAALRRSYVFVSHTSIQGGPEKFILLFLTPHTCTWHIR